MPSPLRVEHGFVHSTANLWIKTFAVATPRARVSDNATHILSSDSELQPDLSLIITGGQTHVNEMGYVQGAPELAIEVSSSSEAYDLSAKKRDYEKYGAQEYLVLVLREKRAVWFGREQNRFIELAEEVGILRSRLLPGLWLDVNAVFRDDTARLLKVLQLGMATPEHAAFVQSLKNASGFDDRSAAAKS